MISFGYGQTPEEFAAARAQTRLFIEMLDVATPGKLQVTVAFDIGGFMATQVDINEANISFATWIEATTYNAIGLGGMIGAIPLSYFKEGAVMIDTTVFMKINSLLSGE
jgi:hypothetical protein